MGRTSLDDRSLVERAKQGDRDAFGSLIERHQTTVYNIVYRMVRDREAALDIAQDSFVQALSHLESFDEKRPFSPWLYRIAHNRSLNYLKRTSHRAAPRPTADEFLEQSTATTSRELGPEERAEGLNLGEALQREIHDLPSKLKSAFVLRYLEDRSLAGVAEILRLPVNTIKTHLFRARERLRVRLHHYFEGS